MSKVIFPSNLELQVLSILWYEGPSTVSVVKETLPDGHERAYTTVLSVIQSLERKKLVKRVKGGRAYIYEPAHRKEIIVRHATEQYLTNTFGGRLGEAVLAILSTGSLTPDEKTTIEKELQKHKTMAAKKTVKKVAAKTVKKSAPVKTAKKVVSKSAPAKKIAAKPAPAKKAVTKSAPAKKALTKKVATKSVTARKAVTKKVPAKKSPAKKVAPAKKVVKKK